MDAVPGLARFVPDFELLIDDLTDQDDEALASRPLTSMSKVVLWLLRDGRSIDRRLPSSRPETPV